MIEYTVYNAEGKAVRSGTCPPELLAKQANQGERAVRGIVTQEPDVRIVNYTYNRMIQYPPIGEQLDAVFKMAKALQEQGITLPDATSAWITNLQAVKDKYPKGGV